LLDTGYQKAMVKGFFYAAISVGIACPFFINGKNDGAAGIHQELLPQLKFLLFNLKAIKR